MEYLQQKYQIISRIINLLICIINCQNVVIMYNTRVWREHLQQKYQIIRRIINNIKKIVRNVRKTDEIWVSRKDIIEDGLGVKNISDLVLKEIYGIYEKKKINKKRN